MTRQIGTWTWIVALLTVATACGESDTLFSSGEIALADVPPKYAAELCSAYERCLGKEVYALFTNGTDCAKQTEQRILNGEFPQYRAKIDAGKIQYQGAKMQACLDAIHATTCDTLSVRPIPACKAALDGTVAVGGECELSAECKGATFCQSEGGTCPAHCVALLVAGQDCSADEQCESGLSCSGETKKCVAPASLAEPCEYGAPPCAPGLLCIGKEDASKVSGACKSPSETFSGAEGEACDPRSKLCKQGLSCAVDTLTVSGGTFKCVKTGGYAAGAACKLAFPEACAAGNYCKAAGATLVVDGTCTRLPAAGEACGATFLNPSICPANTACVEGKCQELVANGVSCFGDAMCYSEHCAANGCQAKLPCN
jgi:hypothetical protein